MFESSKVESCSIQNSRLSRLVDFGKNKFCRTSAVMTPGVKINMTLPACVVLLPLVYWPAQPCVNVNA